MGVRGAVLVSACVALAGCAQKERTPAATSTLSEDAALAMAGRIAHSVYPALSFSSVQPTGSMRPTLDEHSVILLEPYNGQILRVGDIVEYYRDGLRIIHRVIEVRPTGVVTKGDANELPDPFVRYPEISRRYVGQIVFAPPRT